jgi:predicted neutral ceramidase superfamily lipid hydrolase
MRRYYISLLLVSLVLILASFMVMWFAPKVFIVAMPLLVLYFAILTLVQHTIVVKAMQRSPKTFVQLFLGTTVGVLFIHLIVLATFLLTTPAQGRRFLIAFCIGYVVYLVFETVALVRYVDNEKKKRQN